MRLGTLRYVLVRTYDAISAGGQQSERIAVRDGDRYAYALDGLLINVESIANEYRLRIDFSIIDITGTETKIVENLPYSLRIGFGTVRNYIPLKKDTGYPILPARGNVYFRLRNEDSSDISGVALALLAYPVLGEEQ